MPDWTPATNQKVRGLGAFMSAPCFPDGKGYPELDPNRPEDAGVVGAVQARLRPLNRLLVELVGVELSWAGRAGGAGEGGHGHDFPGV